MPTTSNDKVKIVLLTGYLGAGKTTLLNHILSNRQGIRAAVIVNDIGEVNVDADLIANSGAVTQSDDIIPLTNGCICCTLSSDLTDQLENLAKSGDFDYIIIEASGICDPAPIAYAISALCEDTEESPALLSLDNIVAVVDCARMWEEFNEGKDLLDDDVEEDDIVSLLIGQIEFCTTLVMNKVDLVTPDQLAELKAIVRSLQKKAIMIEATNGDISLDEVLDTGRFNFEDVYMSAAWVDAMEHAEEHAREGEGEHEHGEHGEHGEGEGAGEHGEHGEHGEGAGEHGHEHAEHEHGEHGREAHAHHEGHTHHERGHDHAHDDHDHEGHVHHHGHHHHHHHGPETLEYGISTFVYLRRKPLDIEKLGKLVEVWPREIIRCKGILWQAGAPDDCYLFEQAGKHFYMTENGQFIAAYPEDEQQAIFAENPQLLEGWDPQLGDRMNKLVFIGQHMDRADIEQKLDECLAE